MLYAIFGTNTIGGPNKSDQIVGWCILQSAPGLTWKYKYNHFFRILFDNCNIKSLTNELYRTNRVRYHSSGVFNTMI